MSPGHPAECVPRHPEWVRSNASSIPTPSCLRGQTEAVDLSTKTVSTVDDLVGATADAAVRRIVVDGEISGAPSLRLAPGQQLAGKRDGATVTFAVGTDGVQLSRDNEVARLRLHADPSRRAVFNDTAIGDLGTLRLVGVGAVGQVQLLARDQVGAGNVVVDGLDISVADLRDRAERPELLGVGVMQGAFTLWNMQSDSAVVITADLRGIAAGRESSPVRGSGVFVAGAGSSGGRLDVSVLDTGPVYTDSGLAEGTHDTISGGVFVVYDCHVHEVHNSGPVTTHGVNGMVLDNWGVVDRWVARAPLTSYGRSGVGFVNFGAIGTLRIEAAIETHGVGARGFNVYRLDDYTGPTVENAEFDRIVTHADAAIGIQVGQPIGHLVVRNGIETRGGAGDSLVRGVITRLEAHALSVQPGGRVLGVDAGGPLSSAGPGVVAVDIQGTVGEMRVAGGIASSGEAADALRVSGDLTLRDTEVRADRGVAVRATSTSSVELHNVRAAGAYGDVVVERHDPAG
jgi:hypothetical protein